MTPADSNPAYYQEVLKQTRLALSGRLQTAVTAICRSLTASPPEMQQAHREYHEVMGELDRVNGELRERWLYHVAVHPADKETGRCGECPLYDTADIAAQIAVPPSPDLH